MNRKEALEIVLELAESNALNSNDITLDTALVEEALRQEEALLIVNDYIYSELSYINA